MENFIGQERIRLFLSNLLANLKNQNEPVIIPALFFIGADHLGKTTLAKEFARNLLCLEHNDFNVFDQCDCSSCVGFKNSTNQDFYFWDAGNDNSIDIARSVIRFLSLRSVGNNKVLIIDNFDKIRNLVQNVLLKSIEEPPAGASIILITSKPGLTIETIKSRVIAINFRPPKQDILVDYLNKTENRQDDLESIIKLCLGRPGLIVNSLGGDKAYKDAISDLVKLINGDFYFRSQYFKNLFSKDADFGELSRNLFNYWILFISGIISFKMGIDSNFNPFKELNKFIENISVSKLTLFLKNLISAQNILSVGLNNQLVLETVFLTL